MKRSIVLAGLVLVLAGAAAQAHPGGVGGVGGPGGHRGPRGRGGHGPAKALLRAADADDSKSVTADEFAAFLDGLITDENGAVDLADLATKLPAPREGFPEDADVLAGMLTRGFDVDGDGMVTRTDLQTVFDALDRNADGAIDRSDATRRAR